MNEQYVVIKKGCRSLLYKITLFKIVNVNNRFDFD